MLTIADAASGQTRNVRIEYYARANPISIQMCTGESRDIKVYIQRLMWRTGPSPAALFVGGGRTLAVINDQSVGHFEPADAGRNVVGHPDPHGTYTFVADKPGQTTIDLVIHTTGEEASLGVGFVTDGESISVEVTDCYQAHTSGLGAIFTESDMGGLDKPFLLSGYTPNTRGITTETQFMFFAPNPQDRLRGGHAFIDTSVTALGGMQGQCTLYFSGRYEVVFYIPPSQPAPADADVGDLMLYGRGSLFCQGRYMFDVVDGGANSPAFQISFKPKPVN